MTPAQVKAKFRREGRTFTSFARENKYPLHDVYRVLNGQYKGHYGRAHEIAVRLGLKTSTEQQAA